MMISFSGKLNRKAYWKSLIFGTLVFIPVSLVLFWMLDLQGGDDPRASTLQQTLSIVFFILYLASIAYYVMFLLSVVFRRSRDAGNVVLWTVISILVPFGFVVLGLVPSRK